MHYTAEEIVKQATLTGKLHEQASVALARLQHMLSVGTSKPIPEVKPTLLNAAGKLTEHGVQEMYRMFSAGDRDSQVSDHFGISQSAVHARRKTWKRLKRHKPV